MGDYRKEVGEAKAGDFDMGFETVTSLPWGTCYPTPAFCFTNRGILLVNSEESHI